MSYQIPTALSSRKPTTPYVVVEDLGEGAFGKVVKIKRTSDGKILAMKKIDVRKMGKKALESLENETQVNFLADHRIHCSLDHRFIVKVDSFEYDKKREHMHIFMDLCEGGDLDAFIGDRHERNEPLDEDTIWKLFSQLVLALHHCHDPSSRENGSTMAVIHRDLKPANIFMTKDHKQIRLGDFGLARELAMNEYASSNCGTDAYLAPEVHSDEDYNQSADIFSLGAVMYELITLNYLVPEDSDHPNAKDQILAGVDGRIPSRYSPQLGRLIRTMLSSNDMERPTTTELLKMPGICWGIALTSTDKDQKALSGVHKQLRAEKAKAAAQSAQLEDKIRDLERKLEQAQQAVKTRTVALDIREQALNKREANLKTEIARSEAKIRKALEARERQLLQDRLAFAARSCHKIVETSLVAKGDRSNVTSERSTGSAASDTASAVSSALRCGSVVTSAPSSRLKNNIGLAARQAFVPQNNQGLHRVAKRYNLRSQAEPGTDSSSTSGSKLVSLLPQRKLRSDGDLVTIAVGANDKENIPRNALGKANATSEPNSSCNAGRLAVIKQRYGTKVQTQAANSTKPSGIPIYHLRSAAIKCNGALELRRAGL